MQFLSKNCPFMSLFERTTLLLHRTNEINRPPKESKKKCIFLFTSNYVGSTKKDGELKNGSSGW
jgi:hypothetical protein